MIRGIIRCARRKRSLSGREARYLGIGPTCARKNPALAAQLRAEAEGQMRLFEEKAAYPWTVKEMEDAVKAGEWEKIIEEKTLSVDASRNPGARK